MWGCFRLLILSVFFTSVGTVAEGIVLPQSLSHLILSDSAPFSFAPTDWNARDFQLEWVGAPIPGVSFGLDAGSLEWVRVQEVLVLPRGRMWVRAESMDAGQLRHSRSIQSFEVDEKTSAGSSSIPIALISGKKNSIRIKVRRGDRVLEGEIAIRFRAVDPSASRIALDHTCSKFGIQANDLTISTESWVSVGCRYVFTYGESHKVGSLELYVFWDNVGQNVSVDRIETASSLDSVWLIRARKQPGVVRFQSKRGSFDLNYRVGDRAYWAFLGVGIGPYLYRVDGGSDRISTVAPVLTIYSSFLLTEAMRIVAFNATSIHSSFFTDLGLYLMIEQVRAIDSRFSLRFLLGGHTLGFRYQGKTYFRISAPQGIEVTFNDFLKKNHNLGLGGFLHPSFSGSRSYYNVWIRWGKPSFFVEYNFISWREEVDNNLMVNSRSSGISVGFPLAQFF